MLTARVISLLILATVVARESTAAAAGFAGNGCDTLPVEQESAWFLGSQAIHVCIDSTPGFGATDAELSDAFRWAAGKWTQYIKDKQVNARAHDGLGGLTNERLATNFVLDATCDGHQDLRIEAGVTSAEAAAAKQHMTAPIAFVVPISRDLRAGWSKGLLWLAPSGTVIPPDTAYHGHPYWTHAPNLRIILLHELGHILGNSHIKGTIMDADLEGILRYPAVPLSRMRTSIDRIYQKIDRDVELTLCRDCAASYSEGPATEILDRTWNRAWETLIERPIIGDYRVTVSTANVFETGLDFKVFFSDNSGVVTLNIWQITPLAYRSGDATAFKIATYFSSANITENLLRSNSLYTESMTSLAIIQSPSGAKHSIVVNRNMNSMVLGLALLNELSIPQWIFEGQSAY